MPEPGRLRDLAKDEFDLGNHPIWRPQATNMPLPARPQVPQGDVRNSLKNRHLLSACHRDFDRPFLLTALRGDIVSKGAPGPGAAKC
jgi:hypothetical protein